MSTLQNRIEDLQLKTTSPAVFNACNEALSKINKNKAYVTTNESELETGILNELLESIDQLSICDTAANGFVSQKKFEDREQGLNDLGVRDTFESLKTNELNRHPAFSYSFEKIKKETAGLPDWKIIESVIAALTPYNWNPIVNERLQILVANAGKYREDIAIHKIVEGLKTSPSSNYLYAGIAPQLEGYLKNRTSADRISLMEKAGKFLFDSHMKSLYNFLGESERSFHIMAKDNTCSINRIYSPIHLAENAEYFVANNKTFKKSGDSISIVDLVEMQSLPTSFYATAQALQLENVVIANGEIKIYAGDKKIVINEENGVPSVSINGNKVRTADIHRVYLASGVFKMNESESIKAINAIVENWNTIFEIDFAKTILSKANQTKKATVFFVGENIFVSKEDKLMNEDVFYPNCTAVQAKNIVMEYMKFDISSAFSNLLNEEEKLLKQSQDIKEEYIKAIDILASRKQMLEKMGTEITSNEGVKELINILDEELAILKSEYSNLASAEIQVTQVTEGMNVGDEAEFEKKK